MCFSWYWTKNYSHHRGLCWHWCFPWCSWPRKCSFRSRLPRHWKRPASIVYLDSLCWPHLFHLRACKRRGGNIQGFHLRTAEGNNCASVEHQRSHLSVCRQLLLSLVVESMAYSVHAVFTIYICKELQIHSAPVSYEQQTFVIFDSKL